MSRRMKKTRRRLVSKDEATTSTAFSVILTTNFDYHKTALFFIIIQIFILGIVTVVAHF